MNVKHIAVVIAVVFSLSWEAWAETSQLRVRALRQARKMARSAGSSEVAAFKNTNFDGMWGGRYVYSSRGSSCGTRISSFQFRHLVVTKGSSGYISTNHDGSFNGRSRDKGRRWEFTKGISVNGRPALLAIVYQNLARNGNSAVTAIGINISGGCLVVYGANSVRLAR
jgi:hypothetical protein